MRRWFVLMLLALTACGGTASPAGTASTAETAGAAETVAIPGDDYRFNGMTSSVVKPAPDFTLTDQAGQPFHLLDQGGKVVLIYFGYTHCPDLCPTTLSDFKTVKRLLGSNADRVRFVFITVDPARDTPEVMRQYVAAFDPSFIAITPTAAQLADLSKRYDLQTELATPDQSGSYAVAHTSLTYVVDRSGQMRLMYPTGSGFPAKSIAQDVAYLLGHA